MQKIYIEGADLPFIEKLIGEKDCSYQVKEGGNLFCSAGTLEDYRKGSNLPNRAVTSRAICRQCNLPDASYICSNLSHPAIMARQVMGAQFSRLAVGALCDNGEPGAENNPSQYRPGGHRCWERVVELEVESPIIPVSALALAEAFDYLEAVWRNVFGPNHRLLRLTTVMGMAQLAQPCKTLDEFETRSHFKTWRKVSRAQAR